MPNLAEPKFTSALDSPLLPPRPFFNPPSPHPKRPFVLFPFLLPTSMSNFPFDIYAKVSRKIPDIPDLLSFSATSRISNVSSRRRFHFLRLLLVSQLILLFSLLLERIDALPLQHHHPQLLQIPSLPRFSPRVERRSTNSRPSPSSPSSSTPRDRSRAVSRRIGGSSSIHPKLLRRSHSCLLFR